jgi:hypothetical protein
VAVFGVSTLVLGACSISPPNTAHGPASGTRAPGQKTAPEPLANMPANVSYAGFVAEGDDGRLVLLGSISSGGSLEHPLMTFVWDGARWWNMHTPGPSVRVTPALAYDPISSRIILFGGTSWTRQPQSPVLVDTWAWDRVAWKELRPTHIPPQLYEPALTYDPARRQLMLIGASFETGPSGGILLRKEETWAWDGSDWNYLSPAVTPPPRRIALIGSDLVNRRVIFQGGYSDDKGALSDTWSWDGTTWREVSTGSGPLYHYRVTVASFDPTSHHLLAFSFPDETWLWDDGRWLLQPPEPTPSGAVWVAADPSHGRLMAMAEGESPTRWSWDGAKWILLDPLALGTWRTYVSPLGFAIDYPPFWYLMPGGPSPDSTLNNPIFINRDLGSLEAGSVRTAWMGLDIFPKPCSESPWTLLGFAGPPATLGGLPGNRVSVHFGFGVQVNRDSHCHFLYMTGHADNQTALGPVFEEVVTRFRFVPVTASAARTS